MSVCVASRMLVPVSARCGGARQIQLLCSRWLSLHCIMNENWSTAAIPLPHVSPVEWHFIEPRKDWWFIVVSLFLYVSLLCTLQMSLLSSTGIWITLQMSLLSSTVHCLDHYWFCGSLVGPVFQCLSPTHLSEDHQ